VRILHITDVHCGLEPLHRVLSTESFDIVVVSGDLECVEAAEELEPFKDRAVAVTGNVDDISVRRYLQSLGVLIDGRVRELGGLRLGGVGGIDHAGDVMALRSDLSKAGRLDVLVTHHPPKGVLDRTFMGVRVGLKSIRELSLTAKPRVHLFGHVHESPGYQDYEGIVAVNPGPLRDGRYALIELTETDVKVSLRSLA
jgi:Icc-related predicted phosphoesterase